MINVTIEQTELCFGQPYPISAEGCPPNSLIEWQGISGPYDEAPQHIIFANPYAENTTVTLPSVIGTYQIRFVCKTPV